MAVALATENPRPRGDISAPVDANAQQCIEGGTARRRPPRGNSVNTEQPDQALNGEGGEEMNSDDTWVPGTEGETTKIADPN